MLHSYILKTLQVGIPQRYGISEIGQPVWETSFFRTPTSQPRWLYRTHLEGCEQADKQNHGRPDQAVLLYASTHYPLWKNELGISEIGPGGFGENFTVEGLSEETACIGDIYTLGEAQIQVSGPRYPCWKIERRWNLQGLTARVAETGRTGWYCRVLREGAVEPGMTIELTQRPYPTWTVALTNDFAHSRNKDLKTARELASCPLLHEFWQELVVRQAQKLN